LSLFPQVKAEKIPFRVHLDLSGLHQQFEKVVVLAGGDPLLFGVLDWVLQSIPPHEVEVIPGISSVQYMLARLCLPLKDAAVVSLHGREGQLSDVVRKHATVVVFTDAEHTPVTIAQELLRTGLTDCCLYVGENLSCAEESIHRFRLEELARMEDRFGLNLVVICRCIPFSSVCPTVFFDVEMFP
jgi:cobalt-precorrin-7 (C5)-methyltransferase